MNEMQVGKTIAALRKEKGMTQKDLAQLLHVTDKAVSKWERGINFPELGLMEPLATALDTSVVHLLALDQASNLEIVSTVSSISLQEKQKLVKDLRFRSVLNLLIGIVLLFALIYAGNIFHTHGIYGIAQSLTTGMCGFAGTLIGSEIYAIVHLPRLSK